MIGKRDWSLKAAGIWVVAGMLVAEDPVAPEITEALAPLRALEAKAAEAKKKRLDQYVADLEKLEKSVAKETGDLEQVIVVRKEKEAWAKGEKTDPIDPKNETKPLGLRKLRYYFDQDVEKLERTEAEALSKAREQAVATLKELEAQFTREKKIELAVAARKEAGVVQRDIAFGEPENTPVSLAEGPGTSSSNPAVERKGHLRGFGKTFGGVPINVSPFEKFDDFVSVRLVNKTFVALRENGTLYLGPNPDRKVRNVRAYSTNGMAGSWAWVLVNGNIESPKGVVETARGKQFVQVAKGYRGEHAAIGEDGKLWVWGKGPGFDSPDRLLENPLNFPKPIKILANTGSIFVLAEDRKIYGWMLGGAIFGPWPKEDVEIQKFDLGLAVDNNGAVRGFPKAANVPDLPGPAIDVRTGSGFVAVKLASGKWLAWSRVGESKISEKIVATINGFDERVIDFHMHYAKGDPEHCALLWIEEEKQ